MKEEHNINETSSQIKLDTASAAILYAELAQIKKVCKEGNGWCKRDIGRAIHRLQQAITSKN